MILQKTIKWEDRTKWGTFMALNSILWKLGLDLYLEGSYIDKNPLNILGQLDVVEYDEKPQLQLTVHYKVKYKWIDIKQMLDRT